MVRQRLLQQQVAEEVITVFGQFVLLGAVAVVLKGQYHWIFRGHESAVGNRLDAVLKVPIYLFKNCTI